MSPRMLADRLDTPLHSSSSHMIGNLDVTQATKADLGAGVDLDPGREISDDRRHAAASRFEEVAKARGKPTDEVASIGRSVNPGLFRDPQTGQIKIDAFKTVSFAAKLSSCRQFGQMILQDVKAPANALQVLAEDRLISVLRICADNGSVVLSCRNGIATISPRKVRPGDGCSQRHQT